MLRRTNGCVASGGPMDEQLEEDCWLSSLRRTND